MLNRQTYWHYYNNWNISGGQSQWYAVQN